MSKNVFLRLQHVYRILANLDMLKPLLLSAILLTAPIATADITAPASITYAQVMIHTADGGTYVVTGNLGEGSFVYKAAPGGNFVACMVVNEAIGLPPATNDIIFKDGFDADLCFTE
jgi:hypothetical protein